MYWQSLGFHEMMLLISSVFKQPMLVHWGIGVSCQLVLISQKHYHGISWFKGAQIQVHMANASCYAFEPFLHPCLILLSPEGMFGAYGSLCSRAEEYAGDDHQHALCKSVCAHLERKVHAKGLHRIGTVHRGERSALACWCVVKLEKNLYQARTGAKQRITTCYELTASITRGQRSAVCTHDILDTHPSCERGSYCWKCHQRASSLISSNDLPKKSFIIMSFKNLFNFLSSV